MKLVGLPYYLFFWKYPQLLLIHNISLFFSSLLNFLNTLPRQHFFVDLTQFSQDKVKNCWFPCETFCTELGSGVKQSPRVNKTGAHFLLCRLIATHSLKDRPEWGKQLFSHLRSLVPYFSLHSKCTHERKALLWLLIDFSYSVNCLLLSVADTRMFVLLLKCWQWLI